MNLNEIGRSRLLRIASSDQVPGLSENNSRFTISMNDTLDTQDVLAVSVVGVSFPNVFPNVSEAKGNNALPISINGGATQTLVIPDGFYDIDSLGLALVAANIGPAFSVSLVNDATPYVQIIMTAPGDVINIDTSSQLAQDLGYTLAQTVNVANTLVAAGLPSLNGEINAYLHSRVIGSNNQIDAQGDVFSVVCGMPIRAPFFETNFYETPDDSLYLINFNKPRNLQRIEIRLRSLDGRILDVGENGEVVVMLRIYF